jgi:hypothetical protein
MIHTAVDDNAPRRREGDYSPGRNAQRYMSLTGATSVPIFM